MKLDARIRELSERKKRLEQEIENEQKSPSSNDLTIHDLKRRKLRIKDEITTLKSA